MELEQSIISQGRKKTKAFVFLGTIAVALTEWLLFELLRTPYNPPYDMGTFLGREKYIVVAHMFFFGVLWSAAILVTLVLRRISRRDLIHFILLLVSISAAITYIALYPFRPVTPWELL